MKFSKRKTFSTIILSFFVAVIVLTAVIPSIASAAENECISYATINVPAIGELSMPAGLNFLACLDDVAKWIGNLLLEIGGWVLWLSGIFLNVVISYTLLGMKELIDNTDSINVAWRVFRDLANMFFIFIILYIAIMTILRLDTSESKRLLVHVIIVALLLNFSMFFTKVIIDVSNTVTIGFYDTLTGNLPTEDPNIGLSGVFMEHLQLQGLYDARGASSVLGGAKIALNILLMGFLGMILFLILAFLFFAVSILLIARFIILIFLIILSPLAFAAMALPNDQYSKKWWGALFSQVLWVPVFFAMIWVTLIVLDGLVPDTSGVAWTGLVTEGGPNGVPNPSTILLLLNFMIIIGLAVFALVAAKQIGAVGGGTMTRWGGKTAKYIAGGMAAAGARQLIGQPTRFVHDKLMQTRIGQSALGSTILKATTGAAVEAKWGGKSVREAYREGVDRQSAYANVKKARNLKKELGNMSGASQEEKDLKQAEIDMAEREYKKLTYRPEEWQKYLDTERQEKRLAAIKKRIEQKKLREKKKVAQQQKKEVESAQRQEQRVDSETNEGQAENFGVVTSGTKVEGEMLRGSAPPQPTPTPEPKPQPPQPKIISTEDKDWRRRREEGNK